MRDSLLKSVWKHHKSCMMWATAQTLLWGQRSIDLELCHEDVGVLFLTEFLFFKCRHLKVWGVASYMKLEQKINWGLMCGLGALICTLNSPRDSPVLKIELNNLQLTVSAWIHFIVRPDGRPAKVTQKCCQGLGSSDLLLGFVVVVERQEKWRKK